MRKVSIGASVLAIGSFVALGACHNGTSGRKDTTGYNSAPGQLAPTTADTNASSGAAMGAGGVGANTPAQTGTAGLPSNPAGTMTDSAALDSARRDSVRRAARHSRRPKK